MDGNKRPDEDLIVKLMEELQQRKISASKFARNAAAIYVEFAKGGQRWGKYRLKILAEELGVSDKTLQRKIKLTELINELLILVDSGVITEEAGYNLAFLDNESQKRVLQVMQKLKLRKIDGETGERLKKSARDVQKAPKKCSIGSDKIEEIMKSQSRIRACKEALRKEKNQ